MTIVTTAHWHGDSRLGRHADFLGESGKETNIISHSEAPRLVALLLALRDIARAQGDIVLLPDPELFALGSIVARARGKRPVIDIHEDYSKVASGRAWVPGRMVRLVAFGAGLAVWLGRKTAWRVIVAAPELAQPGDHVVLNIPSPGSLTAIPSTGDHRVIYVGDVTIPRGASDMARLIGLLDERFTLVVIGRVDAEARRAMDGILSGDGAERVVFRGRVPHEDAWREAAGALAGLNLLHALPAYREAVATKLWEYMAVGVPPVVSDLPGQRRLVASIHPDLVCGSIEEVAGVLTRLSDADFREEVVSAARAVYLRTWEAQRPDRALQTAVAP